MKLKTTIALIICLIPVLAGCADKQSAANTASEATPTVTAEATTAPEEAITPEPTAVPETAPEPTATPEPTMRPVTLRGIDFSAYDAFYNESATNEAVPYTLTLLSEEETPVSEVLTWYKENELSLPMLGEEWGSYRKQSDIPSVNATVNLYNNVFYDENYIYEWHPQMLSIYDRETLELLYFVEYESDQWYLMGNCASLIDGILYLGNIYNGYAMPGTCFLVAYDIKQDKVLWRSEDQTFNTMNFLVEGDIIFCGYGFTSEADYLYQIDRHTGKVLSSTELRKMPDMMARKDDKLYIHTYSYDYVFQVE